MSNDTAKQVVAGRDVFVSYASQDLAIANSVVEHLEQHGIKCWIAPRDVKPGAQYADAIVRAINEAKTLVLVLSQSSIGSSHVGREIERAASKHKQIIALKVDAAALTPGLEYFLSESQWIDVAALGIAAALAKLAEAVAQGPATAQANPGLGGGDAAGSASIKPAGTASVAKRVVVAAGLIVVLGVSGVLAVRFWPVKQGESHAPVAAASSDKSIVVLPFADMSEKKDQEYFSDGLSEDLITALSQFSGLKVIGRTSAIQFRDSKEDSRSIGAKLGVAHLLEGSVRRSGEVVRVSAELIDAADGSTQWSERYDRPYKDLFALQDEITRAVTGALKAKLVLGKHAAAQTERPPNGNLEAYSAMLQGRFYLLRETEDDTRKSIEYYAQATRLDPRYAFAWSGLSRAWSYLGEQFLVVAPMQEAYAKARETADRALSLAPELAAAHVARGFLFQVADFDWRGAEVEYRRALTLAPDDGEAKFWVGNQLAIFGELESAINLTQQALVTEPLRADWYSWLAPYLLGLNRVDEAERAIRRALELQPAATGYHWQLAIIEVQRGNAEAALAAADREPPGYWQDGALALARQIGSDRAAADTALRTLIEKDANIFPYGIAQVYALRKDAKETFVWLERAFSSRDPGIVFLLYDPFILRYKDDPRFIAYCRRVGLPVPGDEERTVSQ